jgi:spermidine synthase
MSLFLGVLGVLSGMAALLFETLWFRLAGLAFGNSVWASSIVLAAFMCGLGLGNVWVFRFGRALRRPERVYALLEVLVGSGGLTLVWTLPRVTFVFGQIFARLAPESPWLNPLRLALAFALLAVPTAAMGATLPVLVSALARRRSGFGASLGWLYGANTLGAVLGALLGEMVFIPRLGLRHTGFLAAALDVLAAALALTFSLTPRGAELPLGPRSAPHRGPGLWRILLATSLAGANLLALEIVWFRFLQLFTPGLAVSFAVMLAVILAGIACGSLAAGARLSRSPSAHQLATTVALVAGSAAALGYARFESALALGAIDYTWNPWALGFLSVWLMGGAAVSSGVLFTLFGASLQEMLADSALTTAALTLANTAGATSGALAAGFVLLPRLGLERSLVLLALSYGLVAALAAPPRDRGPRRAALFGAVAFATALALFPFGLMKNAFIPRIVRRFALGDERAVAVREGLTETSVYLRRDSFGLGNYRLVTNGFSMSDTGFFARRYMQLFAYWPLVLKGDPRSALLISYGLGSTAAALARIPTIETIDIVDISRDILDMGRSIYPPPGPPPLGDPRVRTHVEDGRFFLLTTGRTFDIITAEPPPPRFAGIVNLYSEEYFALIKDRLRSGGVATYWLPVKQLSPRAVHGLVRGFCEVFVDCSLWTGKGLEWMLVGTRSLTGPTSEATFSAPWQDPTLSQDLRSIGLDTPESLGSLFLADAPALLDWAGGDPPLRDDNPGLLAEAPGDLGRNTLEYDRFSDSNLARRRFAASRFIAAHWPAGLRERSLSRFADIALFDRILSKLPETARSPALRLELLNETLRSTRSPSLALVAAGTEPRELSAVDAALLRGESSPGLEFWHGVGLVADHHYAEAAAVFSRVATLAPDFNGLVDLHALALCRNGDPVGAARELTSRGRDPARDPFWSRALETCDPKETLPAPGNGAS